MIQQLYTIGRHTFLESIRQPVFVVLVLAALLALVLNPSLAAYSLENDNKLLIDMGLSTLFLAGLMMAVFTTTGVLSEEVENKTVLTVISKPVARPVFVAGKYLGGVGAIGLGFWPLCVVFLLTVRHKVMQTATDPFDGPVLLFGVLGGLSAAAAAVVANYLYRAAFASTFILNLFWLMSLAWALVLLIDKQWQFQPPATDLDPQMLTGLFLIFQAVMILTAVAVAVSTRLGRTMTLTACVVTFGLGLLSDHLFGRLSETHAAARIIYAAVPNLQLFWPADALTQGYAFTARYVALVTGYTAIYITALISLAVALFQGREIS